MGTWTAASLDGDGLTRMKPSGLQSDALNLLLITSSSGRKFCTRVGHSKPGAVSHSRTSSASLAETDECLLPATACSVSLHVWKFTKNTASAFNSPHISVSVYDVKGPVGGFAAGVVEETMFPK